MLRWTCRNGTNNSAMFAEIVPEQKRSTVYAFDRSFEGAVAACAAPVVGELSCRSLQYQCGCNFAIAGNAAAVYA